MTGKTSTTTVAGVDRRVQRTRTALQQALIELIPQKPYEAITVENICEAANVGRSTFYAHYRSKDDLKRGAIDDHLSSMLAERRRSAGSASPTRIILEHVRDFRLRHMRDYSRLHGRPGAGRAAAVAVEAIRRSAADLLREELGQVAGESAFRRELRLQYLVGAFMAVLVWWLERGTAESPEQVENLFRDLSSQGVLHGG